MQIQPDGQPYFKFLDFQNAACRSQPRYLLNLSTFIMYNLTFINASKNIDRTAEPFLPPSMGS